MAERPTDAGPVNADQFVQPQRARRSTGKSATAGVTAIDSERVADLTQRTTEEVFFDHLELRRLGRLEDDIKRNYDESVIIISNVGTFFGHDGVRHSAQLLRLLLPTLNYKFDTLLMRGRIAFEEWEAKASDVEVHNGIDAFVIKDGKIKVQTIWYESEAIQKPASRKRSMS
jgi:hypothetical protein